MKEAPANNLYTLYHIAKKSIADKTFEKDYPVIKKMVKEMSLPLYSFHTLLHLLRHPVPKQIKPKDDQAFVWPDDVEAPDCTNCLEIKKINALTSEKQLLLNDIKEFKRQAASKSKWMIVALAALFVSIGVSFSIGFSSDGSKKNIDASLENKITTLENEKKQLAIEKEEQNLNIDHLKKELASLKANQTAEDVNILSLQQEKSNLEASIREKENTILQNSRTIRDRDRTIQELNQKLETADKALKSLLRN